MNLYAKPSPKSDHPDWQSLLDLTDESGAQIASALTWDEAIALADARGAEVIALHPGGEPFPLKSYRGCACACMGVCFHGHACAGFPFGRPCDGCGRRGIALHLILGVHRCGYCIADKSTSVARLWGPLVEAIRERSARGESTSTVQLVRHMRCGYTDLGEKIEAMQKEGLLEMGPLGWELTEPVKFALERARQNEKSPDPTAEFGEAGAGPREE